MQVLQVTTPVSGSCRFNSTSIIIEQHGIPQNSLAASICISPERNRPVRPTGDAPNADSGLWTAVQRRSQQHNEENSDKRLATQTSPRSFVTTRRDSSPIGFRDCAEDPLQICCISEARHATSPPPMRRTTQNRGATRLRRSSFMDILTDADNTQMNSELQKMQARGMAMNCSQPLSSPKASILSHASLPVPQKPQAVSTSSCCKIPTRSTTSLEHLPAINLGTAVAATATQPAPIPAEGIEAHPPNCTPASSQPTHAPATHNLSRRSLAGRSFALPKSLLPPPDGFAGDPPSLSHAKSSKGSVRRLISGYYRSGGDANGGVDYRSLDLLPSPLNCLNSHRMRSEPGTFNLGLPLSPSIAPAEGAPPAGASRSTDKEQESPPQAEAKPLRWSSSFIDVQTVISTVQKSTPPSRLDAAYLASMPRLPQLSGPACSGTSCRS